MSRVTWEHSQWSSWMGQPWCFISIERTDCLLFFKCYKVATIISYDSISIKKKLYALKHISKNVSKSLLHGSWSIIILSLQPLRILLLNLYICMHWKPDVLNVTKITTSACEKFKGFGKFFNWTYAVLSQIQLVFMEWSMDNGVWSMDYFRNCD